MADSSTETDLEWIKRVLARLERKIDALNGRVVDNRERLTKVEVKAGLWGALGGLVASVGAVLAWIWSKLPT